MRDVNFYLALVLGLMIGTGPVYAAEPVEEDEEETVQEETVQSDVPAEKNPLRPNLQNEVMSKPVMAKKLYREAWTDDNVKGMSSLEQLEHFRKNGPALDPDLEAIMDSGMKIMEKMNYGMENVDLSEKAEAIQSNPPRAIQDLSEKPTAEMSTSELLSIIAETSEATQRLGEKVYKDKTLGKTSYPVDVDSF
ncbi:MAG: hypothetical protein IKS41_03875 [Alphaproteobacteria bacterium]|nr:hypothetical protein [Alphaproteobacteria bacterium]